MSGVALLLTIVIAGCSGSLSHYARVERSLMTGHMDKAVDIVQSARDDYGRTNHLLYLMDRGMVLQLAGRYEESNQVLEEAYLLVEDHYTKRLREEASAMLVNEARRPYEGAPHEHVMINVLKALNYAFLQQWEDALVEARRIDHRLNVLTDAAEESDAYHEDPFARYVVGLLYDIAGDWNNAYVGYRKAERVYEETRAWTRVPLPDMLKRDLIRTADRLGLEKDAERYRLKYPEAAHSPEKVPDPRVAQLVVVGYHGQGPKKEDLVIDVPVSLDALRLVAITKAIGAGRSTRATRGGEAFLYGIHGRIARIALPRFSIPKRVTAYDTVEINNEHMSINTRSEQLYDIHAAAEKTLADEYDRLVVRAVARAAIKISAAEGIGIGVGAAAGRDHGNWIGPLVGGLARIFALMTEEADIRAWQTLPGEIQLTRLWVEPGDYSLTIQTRDQQGREAGESQQEHLNVQEGETRFFLHHLLR